MNSATAAMLDGIKEACSSWGRTMRWMLQATGEGYPSIASIGRINEGDMEISASNVRQRFGEVMLKDALAVSVAIRRAPIMPEELHRALFMHFVVPRRDGEGQEITVVMKAKELGYARPKPYYLALDNGYHFLLGRIDVGMPVLRSNGIAQVAYESR